MRRRRIGTIGACICPRLVSNAGKPRRFCLWPHTHRSHPQRFECTENPVVHMRATAGQPRRLPHSAIERVIRAGFPPTSVFGGTSRVTTEPAPTTAFSPTVTPPMIVARPVRISFGRAGRRKRRRYFDGKSDMALRSCSTRLLLSSATQAKRPISWALPAPPPLSEAENSHCAARYFTNSLFDAAKATSDA